MIKPYLKVFFFLLINLFINRLHCQTQYSENLLAIKEKMESDRFSQAMTELKNITESSLNKPDKAYYNFLMAQCLDSNDEFNKAYQYFLKAKKLYIEIDSIDMAMDINMDISNLIHAQQNPTDIYKKYFKEYMDYAEKSNNPEKLARGYVALANFKFEEKNSTRVHSLL